MSRAKELILSQAALLPRLETDLGRGVYRYEGYLHLLDGGDYVPVQMGVTPEDRPGDAKWFILDAAYDSIEQFGQEAANAVVNQALADMDAGIYSGTAGHEGRQFRWRLEERPPGSLWYQTPRKEP